MEKSRISATQSVALFLWCIGLGVVTFDQRFTFEVRDFTIKGYYFIFLAASALFYGSLLLKAGPKGDGFWDVTRKLFLPPWAFAFLLFVYELAFSPYSYLPMKSAAYSIWLLFDIVVVALPGAVLLSRVDPEDARAAVTTTLCLAAIGLTCVVFIDHIAFYFGYIEGLIGYNQAPSLKWGISRAHAFSYEPSYLSLYFSFSFLILVGELLSERRSVSLKLHLPAVVCLMFSLFLLGARTGWLLNAIGLAYLLARHRDRWWRREAVPLLLGIVAVAALALFVLISPEHRQSMYDRLVSTILSGTDGSGNTRLRSMVEGLRTAAATGWLGTGVGASYFFFIANNPGLGHRFTMGGENIMSIWAQLPAESGVAGVLLFFLFGATMVFTLWRSYRADRGVRTDSYFISCLLFFVIAAHLVGNVARTDVWVWFAVWMGLAPLAKTSRALTGP